jgi:hypothetical protein
MSVPVLLAGAVAVAGSLLLGGIWLAAAQGSQNTQTSARQGQTAQTPDQGSQHTPTSEPTGPATSTPAGSGATSTAAPSSVHFETPPTKPDLANGAFVRGAETGRVYRVVGGAPLWLSTCVDGCPGVVNLPQAEIDGEPKIPVNGTFVRGSETGRVYRMAGGAPLWLSTCVAGCPGLVNVNQWTIDSQLPKIPANGVFVRGIETGRVYRMAGGAPLWLSTCVDGCPDLVDVNQLTIDSRLPKIPVNHTLLLAIESGRVYEVRQGVPVSLSACPAGGCGPAVRVNQSSIDKMNA